MNYSRIDPLASEFDRSTSIGYIDTVGHTTDLITEEIGRKKRTAKERQKRFEGEMRRHEKRTKTAAQVLAKIDNHPATNATLTAMAAVVPYGTAAAGIVKAGLLITRGVLAFANSKAGKAIHKGLNKVASAFRKDPERRERRKARKARRKARREERRAKKKGQPSPERLAFKAGLAEELRDRTDVKANAKAIAKVIVKSNQGDKAAQAEFAALQALASPKAVAERAKLSGDKKTAAIRAKLESAIMKTTWKEAAGLAKAVEGKLGLKSNPKNAAVQKKVAGVVKEALKTVQKKAPQKAVEGLLVLPGKNDIKEGAFKLGGKATSFLVKDDGRIESGSWF